MRRWKLLQQLLSLIVIAGVFTVGVPGFMQEATPEVLINPAPERLIADLRQGGYVLFMRHGLTEERQDSADFDLTRCWTQRNLSQAGREQAQAVGDAFRALTIPIANIWSSPYCRTRETAEYAFGADNFAITYDLLSAEFPRLNPDDMIAAFQRLISTPPPIGMNTMLVGHVFNLREATGVSLSEAGIAVFQPLPEDNFQLIARLSADEWQSIAAEIVP